MSTQEMMQSKNFRIAAVVAGVFLVAIVSFAGGLAVGFHKARFSYAFGENYERNFIGGPRGMMPGERGGMMERAGFPGAFDGRDFRNAYGTTGTILSISDSTIIVKDKDDKENAVAAREETLIKSGRATVTLGNLKVGDRIVVVGQPGDNGVVNATLIRVFGQGSINQ
ncbi:MAG: hypothetical protein Q8Q10_00035 [bacterium]|nr:hypothetical protein [bacterium]